MASKAKHCDLTRMCSFHWVALYNMPSLNHLAKAKTSTAFSTMLGANARATGRRASS